MATHACFNVHTIATPAAGAWCVAPHLDTRFMLVAYNIVLIILLCTAATATATARRRCGRMYVAAEQPGAT